MKGAAGVCLPNYGNNSSREAIVEVAKAAEELGYDSVWTTDHILLPSSHSYPYGKIYESLTTLSYVAALTDNVKLGTSILVLPMRNAVTVAKMLASLDSLSGGRVIAGVAVGWSEQEFKNLGVGHLFKKRGRLLNEQIKVMRLIWRGSRVSFKGHFHEIEDGVSDPRPKQLNGPSVWIGGNSEYAVKRALELGDAWHFTGITLEELDERLRLISQRGGKIPVTGRFTVDLTGKAPRESRAASGARRVVISGRDAQEVINQLTPYVDRGVSYLVCSFGDKPSQRQINDMKRFINDIIPSLF